MLQKSSVWKTASVFFDEPTQEHYLIGISRKISVAHTSVKKHLTELTKAGILKETIDKKGKRAFPIYRADIDSPAYKKYKRIYNYSAIIESGLIEYLERSLAPKAIVLFGSYRKGEDTEDSDIDIFVECEKEELDLKKYEKALARKIELHFKERFKSYPKELKGNIINGIVLSGFLECQDEN